MNRSWIAMPLMAAGGFVMTSPARAAPDAHAIIARAIRAHGGKAAVIRLKSARIKVAGTETTPDGQVIAITLEDAWNLPGQYRTQSTFTLNGKQVSRVLLMNGDRGWTSVNGDVRPMAPAGVTELKEQTYSESFDKLFPLLNPGLSVAVLPTIEVNGRKAEGIRIRTPGHRDVSLYFDLASGLLAKRAEMIQGEGGKKVVREVVYSENKLSNGLVYPTHLAAFYDGHKEIEGTVLELKPVAHLDPSVFTKP